MKHGVYHQFLNVHTYQYNLHSIKMFFSIAYLEDCKSLEKLILDGNLLVNSEVCMHTCKPMYFSIQYFLKMLPITNSLVYTVKHYFKFKK